MAGYIGEYECKMDSKGRIMLPADLRRQLPTDSGNTLIINRGFDQCLSLFARNDWDKEAAKLKSLNQFKRKDRKFIRLFSSGATEVAMDNLSRILIPKKLSAYANLKANIVLYAYDNRIEIWNKELYESELNVNPDDFADLAEEVLGKEGNDE